MQVSEQKDHITHAVIGGGKAIDFGISNSAEFFNILSSTLYKDQILAVVREVLCNAWDAHIEAKCTDRPVKLTLDSDKFVIKDFGTGIHHDDMGLIYGTYGNSTKKNDGNQTGGFGLGCKAPFAYTDQFEVESCHDGVKTLYNLSKSSAQAMGKPGIIPILKLPTKDTGLQVTIPIKNRTDYHRFYELIVRIVRNGDMNMTLNDKPLGKLNFDTTKAAVLITTMSDIIEDQPRIMLRYGNVIYPVDDTQEIALGYERIVDHLDALGNDPHRYNRKTYYIVFQALPHSIAVTPSRESLSMQNHTTKALNDLFSGFVQMLKQDFPPVCNEIAVKIVDEAVKEKRINGLLSSENKLPFASNAEMSPRTITDLYSMATRYMASNYPDDATFRRKDIQYRLKKLLEAGLVNRGLVQTYVRALNSPDKADRKTWLQKHVTSKLLVKLDKLGMETNRLYVYDPDDASARSGVHLVEARKAHPRSIYNALPYLRNIVIVTATLKDVYTRATKHKVFKDYGDSYGFMLYHCGLKKKEKEDAVTFFTRLGMHVVDLTFRQDWEIDPHKPSLPVVRKKPKKGIACLSSVALDKRSIMLTKFTDDNAARIEKPEFVVEVSLRNDMPKGSLGYSWGNEASSIIVQLFGEKGGITNKADIAQKWIDGGAKKMEDYVREKVCAYIASSKTIHEYWSFKYDRVQDASDEYAIESLDLLSTIYHNPTLRAEYGLMNNLTDEDKKYLVLWESMCERNRRGFWPLEMATVRDQLASIPLHRANIEILKKMSGNKMLRIINGSALATIIRRQNEDPAAANDAIALLNLILDK